MPLVQMHKFLHRPLTVYCHHPHQKFEIPEKIQSSKFIALVASLLQAAAPHCDCDTAGPPTKQHAALLNVGKL